MNPSFLSARSLRRRSTRYFRLQPVAGLACSCLALIFGGCATAGGAPRASAPSDFERSAPPSTSVATPGSSHELNGPVLERAAFVRAVLRANPSLESARQGWRAARARVAQSGAFEDPMVDVGVAPLSIGSAKAPFGYELAISQKLPWFGKRALEGSAAAAEADAAKSDYEALQRELALSAVTLYDQYFVAQRELEINTHHVELMRALRATATAQFAAGRASAQDPLQAEAELGHMEHDAAVLQVRRDVTVAQMNELLHRSPEEPLPAAPQELPLPPEPDTRDARHLQAEAVGKRSEIAAAEAHARAAQARADGAEREGYPDFTVSTSYNSMWDMPQHRWMLGVGFNLPLQGGKRAGARDEALAMRSQFASDAARLSDGVRTQVFVALKQIQSARHELRLLEERLLPVAREQADAARAGFIASQNPFMAVIEAEKNLRAVELEYQVARAECDRHLAELERALGRIPGVDGEESPK